MNYNEVESVYLNKLIKASTWASHEQIDDLIRLHAFVLHPPATFNGGMLFTWLKSTYYNQYLILLSEFSSEAVKVELDHQQNRLTAINKLNKDRKAQLELARKAWLLAGGQL